MAYEPGRSDPPGTPGGPVAHDEGVDKRQVARLVAVGVILLGAVAFVVQNSETVETSFLFFTVETRLWVGLLTALVLGAILGQALVFVWKRRRSDDD